MQHTASCCDICHQGTDKRYNGGTYVEFSDATDVLTIIGNGAMPNYEYNSASWFEHAESIVGITIGYGVTSIGEYAFYFSQRLTEITIPESVTAIGRYALGDCSELTSVTIPGSVTSIGDYAFDGCIKLTGITIPESVTSIGDVAFAYCSGLTFVNHSDVNGDKQLPCANIGNEVIKTPPPVYNNRNTLFDHLKQIF